MLTKLQCDILDAVIAMPRFDWDTLLSQLPYKPDEVYLACLALPPLYASVNPIMGGRIAVFALTYQGRNYRELQRLERVQRWKERAIGFVSGAIIASIPWLLGLIRLPK